MTTNRKRLIGALLILLVAAAGFALRSPAQSPAASEQWLAVQPDALVPQDRTGGQDRARHHDHPHRTV